MSRQQPWTIVAAREIVVRLTNKAFLVSTAVMLALIAGSLGLQAFLGTRDDVMHVAVVDDAGATLAQQVAQAAHAQDEHAVVRADRVADIPAARAAVTSDKDDAYLARTATGWEIVSSASPNDRLDQLTQEVVRRQVLAQNARAAGTTVEALTKGSTVTTRALDTDRATREGLAIAVAMLFSVLFLMSSLTFGMQIAASIVEEKASRVVEIVVAAIPVRQLLAGKVVGNTVMALGQIVLFVAVGLIGVSFTSWKSFLPALSQASGWYVVFFLAGFLALACLWALAGSLATRNEDLQSTTSPMTSILMLTYMAGFVAKGTWLTVLSFVPIVSTTLMPVRLFRGEAPWWQAVLSLALTLAFAVGAVLFSERLYRRSLLQTQGRLSLRQAMRIED